MGLFEDFKDQKLQIIVFSVKLVVFLILVFAVDRLMASYLKEGLYQYFGLDKRAEILAIGHSHTVLGIDKEMIEKNLNVNMAKYARSGANLLDRKTMIEQYFELQPKSAKIVIYDVDAHLFTTAGLSRNSYQLFYPFIDTSIINAHIMQAKPPWQELFLRRLFKTSRFSEMLIAQSIRGWLKKWTNLKQGQVNLNRLGKEIGSGLYRQIEFNDQSISLFLTTLEIIKNEGAIVVLVYIPTIDVLNDAEPEKFKRIISFYEKIAIEDKKVFFFNYNELFSHQHELFSDPVHLNPKGQQEVTKILINDLKNIRRVI